MDLLSFAENTNKKMHLAQLLPKSNCKDYPERKEQATTNPV